MPAVIFDFDSTLISCESLEKILTPADPVAFHGITEAGIRGEIPFSESLEKRLQMAAPTRQSVIDFGRKAHEWLTPGFDALIAKLHHRHNQVWIVSGAMREALLPLGKRLGIPESHILGVQLLWGSDGAFQGVNPSDGFSRSKVEGAQAAGVPWARPAIAVGDAMSDYNLYRQGLVDRFIAYTEHFRCEEVLRLGVEEANNVSELTKLLERYAFLSER